LCLSALVIGCGFWWCCISSFFPSDFVKTWIAWNGKTRWSIWLCMFDLWWCPSSFIQYCILFVLKFRMTFLLNPDLVNMYSLKWKEKNEKFDVCTIYDDTKNLIIIRYYILVYLSNFQLKV
jgi:hypothetical protein